MKEIIPLNIALIALALVALGVCVAVARSIIREVCGMEDEADFHAEQREQKRIRKQIEKWREGK